MKPVKGSLSSGSSKAARGSLTSLQCHQSTMEPLDIVFLGAPDVGKTSIIKQYLNGRFSLKYEPTHHASLYTSAVLFENQLFELNIIDIPARPFCPLDGTKKSLLGTPFQPSCSWDDLQTYGSAISRASVLVFVYDITSSDSFQFITDLREHIYDCFDPEVNPVDLPMMIVAGNKHDLHKYSRLARRHISHMVRKTWKCSYLECSSLFNWHIESIFHEAVRLVTEGPTGREGSSSHYRLPIGAWKHCACTIL